MTPQIKGALIGFFFGLAFAWTHLFTNLRYDIPFFVVIRALESFIVCSGRGCMPYLILAGIVSSLVWAGVGVLIGLGVSRKEANSSEEVPRS